MNNTYNNHSLISALVNRQNMINLLIVYNLTYLIFCVLFTDDSRFAFMIASFVSLAMLVVLTVMKIVEDFYYEEAKHHETEQNMLKTIRKEYQKMHLSKIRQDILSKIEEDEPHSCSTEQSGKEIAENEFSKRVHLSYLNGLDSQNLNRDEDGGHHQGV